MLWKQWNGPSWSYGSWIYNYQCNQCLSPLILWVQILIRARCTTLCDKVCQWLVTGRWFSPGPPISSTNNIDHHDITEILLKVALNTIKQTNMKTVVFSALININSVFIEIFQMKMKYLILVVVIKEKDHQLEHPGATIDFLHLWMDQKVFLH